MVVASSLHTNFNSISSPKSHICSIILRPTSPSQLYLRHLCRSPSTPKASNFNGVVSVRAYMEEANSFSSFANKVIGALPVIGLVARILNDEGGVGSDMIDFAEFRRRVGNNCSVNDSRAFYEFQDRHGKTGEALYVLMCCWLAAVGAGLLKSEEILEGVARLRISDDIEFEEQTFIASMAEAREKRAKLRAPTPSIPMNIRAEKALDAIYVCCFGRNTIEEEDKKLLYVMLNAVFPTVGKPEIERMLKEKAKRIEEGSEEFKVPEPKPLPKEAVQSQMKDLEFLQQNSEKK